MNLLRPAARLFCGAGRSSGRSALSPLLASGATCPASSTCFAFRPGAELRSVFQPLPWSHQQARTVKRGTEYQPKNMKRKRTHGWIRRISSRGGIEVILRRMLKGRKSLTH